MLPYAHLVFAHFRLRCWTGTIFLIDYEAAGESVLLCIALQRPADPLIRSSRTLDLARSLSGSSFLALLVLARGASDVCSILRLSLTLLPPLQLPLRPLLPPPRRVALFSVVRTFYKLETCSESLSSFSAVSRICLLRPRALLTPPRLQPLHFRLANSSLARQLGSFSHTTRLAQALPTSLQLHLPRSSHGDLELRRRCYAQLGHSRQPARRAALPYREEVPGPGSPVPRPSFERRISPPR